MEDKGRDVVEHEIIDAVARLRARGLAQYETHMQVYGDRLRNAQAGRVEIEKAAGGAEVKLNKLIKEHEAHLASARQETKTTGAAFQSFAEHNNLDGNVLRFAKPFVKDGFRAIARELATEKLGPLNDRELERQRRQREQHKDRNKEWKRMEREGASMAERRAFAREGRSKGREPNHSPSRFHKEAVGQEPPHCPWRRSW